MSIQRLERANGRNGKRAEDTANLFTGLIRTIDGEKWHKIKNNIPRIAPASFRDGTSDQLSFPFEPLEKFLLNTLAVDISLADVGTEIESPVTIVDELKIQLSDLEATISKLQVAYKASPDSELLIQMAISLSADRTKLLKAIEAEESKIVSQPTDELKEIKALLDDSHKAEARAKLQLIIRRLVKEIRMVTFGTRRSPCKAAEVQIYFRAGGIISCAICCEADRVLSNIQARNLPIVDFRAMGERLTDYLKLREQFYLATFQQFFDVRCERVKLESNGAGKIAQGKWQSQPIGDFLEGMTRLPKA